MTAAVEYAEDYDKPSDTFWHETAVVGWRPDLRDSSSANSLLEFARSLTGTEQRDGERFHYRTVLTNLVGMALERAAGERLISLLQTRIWQKLGPEQDATIVCDSSGFPYVGAGMSACARDLARFGLMLLGDGAFNGSQIVPAEFLRSTRQGSDELRRLFSTSGFHFLFPRGHYQNQMWGDSSSEVLACLGIFGQMIYTNKSNGLVVVKFSSYPGPSEPLKYIDCLLACAAISVSLTGKPPPAAKL